MSTLTTGWRRTLTGLDIRLDPGVWRNVTFDPAAVEGRADLVYLHLGHPLVQKTQRLLRASLWSVDSTRNRVTAVIVEDLPESFAAVVTRMVLVGRGGVRLHEDVFLAGVRLKGRRAMAEDKAEAALNQALDHDRRQPAPKPAREHLYERWNGADSPLRTRLEAAMADRAERRRHRVIDQLAQRRRARDIFAAFRTNLHDSLQQLHTKQSEDEMTLWPDEQRKQWRRRDIDAMHNRLDSLDGEEDRELAAIGERYADVKPHVTAAAVVFALTPADARDGLR